MSRSTEPQATTGPRKNGVGVAALVIGVVGLVLALLVLFFPIAFVLGLIAVILGFVGISRASRGEADNRGQAIAGLVTGLVAVLLALFFTIGIGTIAVQHQVDFRQFGNCMVGADDKQQLDQCGRELTEKLDRP